MHEITTGERERALLAAVDLDEYDVEDSLDELEMLAETAEIDTIARISQKRTSIDRATCIGQGKLEEIADFVRANDIDIVIFDHELSATQLRNIEDACGVPIIDRTMLILDIFADHANSSEGRLQVELARHRYLLPRLSGMGVSLSRLGGGGGGSGAGARRGKGETKLELDRRHIRQHIQRLEGQLNELTRRRDLMRSRRKKDGITTVVIVGYTNVGKSTLLNALTDAGVLAEDKLFATLDPTARALMLPDGRSVMLIDTVGLIRRLPHHLVEAFKSTLEEAAFADLLLNVCDISSEDAAEQIKVSEQLLRDIGVADTPILTVLNKSDRVDGTPLPLGDHNVVVSAMTGEGLDDLLNKISRLLEPSQSRLKLLIPYHLGGLVGEIRMEGKILEQEYVPGGILLDAMVDRKILHKVADYRDV